MTGIKVINENFLPEVRKMFPRGRRLRETLFFILRIEGKKFSTTIDDASHYSFCCISEADQKI